MNPMTPPELSPSDTVTVYVKHARGTLSILDSADVESMDADQARELIRRLRYHLERVTDTAATMIALDAFQEIIKLAAEGAYAKGYADAEAALS